jgi:hypothetical protein
MPPLLATLLGLWHWRWNCLIELCQPGKVVGRQLLLWFTWPAWPSGICGPYGAGAIAIQAGAQSASCLPFWFDLGVVGATLSQHHQTAPCCWPCPPWLPGGVCTAQRWGAASSALIDWFTLLFFSGCAFIIWVIWIAMQTGFTQAQPAANVARLAPGFEHTSHC